MSGAERTLRRRRTGARARIEGRGAEVWAALWLLAQGYRVLGFRLRIQGVEVDLAVRRGPVVALVEVKRRATIEAALQAVTAVQLSRLQRAGLALAARHAIPGRPAPNVRLDLFAMAPGRLPRHIADAWNGATGVGEGSPWR